MVKKITKKDLNEILNSDFSFSTGDSPISSTLEIKSKKTTDDVADIISQRYNKYSPFYNYGYFFENEEIQETLLPKTPYIDTLEDTNNTITNDNVSDIEMFIEKTNNSDLNNYQKYLVLKKLLESIKTNDSLLNNRLINILKDKNEKLLESR